MTAKSKSRRTPSFRHHKASGRAFVELDGRRLYLGKWGLPETEQAYHRTLAEWISNGRRLPVPPAEVTLVELCAAYFGYAEMHYRRPDGTPTDEIKTVKRTLGTLRDLYGPTLVADFGPLQLKAVRHRWIEEGLSRTTINHMMGIAKRAFKWGTSEAMVGPEVFGALQAVSGLQRGRSQARENEPVKPVPDAHVKAVRPYVSRQVWALIQLQLLSGARGGELVKLRAIDFDISGEVWAAKLDAHKTAHRGRERTIYFGPRAQAVVKSFMHDRPLNAFLFSPQDAFADRGADSPSHRRLGQAPTPRETNRTVGDCYTATSYARAIARACKKAGVPHWTPHRLRHNAGTEIRRNYGLEAAQVILGHSTARVTELYAERDREKAIQVVKEIG